MVVWSSLPDQIPAHFDGAGNITRYGGRGILLIMPIINLLMFAGITAIEFFPQIWNTGVRVTEKNKRRVYAILSNMIVTLKLTLVAPFVFISIYQTLGTNMPSWFIPVFLFVCLAPMIFFIAKLIRAR
jgi:uncharacterized membrane protein